MNVYEPGFRLIWADYRGYAEGSLRLLRRGQKRADPPRKHIEMFATRAEAEARRASLRATAGDELVATILPVLMP